MKHDFKMDKPSRNNFISGLLKQLKNLTEVHSVIQTILVLIQIQNIFTKLSIQS